MSKGLTIKVSGLKELQNKFGKLPEKIVKEVDMEMGAAALDFEDRAVQAAPDTQAINKGREVSRDEMGSSQRGTLLSLRGVGNDYKG
jgi:hypothetical protein